MSNSVPESQRARAITARRSEKKKRIGEEGGTVNNRDNRDKRMGKERRMATRTHKYALKAARDRIRKQTLRARKKRQILRELSLYLFFSLCVSACVLSV